MVRFVGIDIGKAKCRVAIMDPSGVILDEFTFTNNHEGIEGLASMFTLDDRVVIDSTGSVWTNLYNHLDEKHIHVALANPLKTKAIASAKIKSDKVDARILAHPQHERQGDQPRQADVRWEPEQHQGAPWRKAA